MDIEIINFISRISVPADFSAWNIEWPAEWPDFNTRVTLRKERIERILKVKEAIGKKITNIDSEVTTPVIDSVKKMAQDCIQSGCHQLQEVALAQYWGKIL